MSTPKYDDLTTTGSRHHAVERVYRGAKSVTADVRADEEVVAALEAAVAAVKGGKEHIRFVFRDAPNAPDRFVVQVF